jgi:hypothetical protein
MKLVQLTEQNISVIKGAFHIALKSLGNEALNEIYEVTKIIDSAENVELPTKDKVNAPKSK